jgi:signal-transduction protein with cAMP-binding, CBS, and nucleotidyltransferase domain
MTVDRILKGHDLFQSLNVDEAHRISQFSSVKTYEANETVFRYNEAARHVFMLMNGSVDLRLPANPPDFSFVISRIEKGELFGLSPLLDSQRYTASAQCREKTELLSIEAAPLRELLRSNYPVGFNVMSQVAHIYFTRYINVLQNLQGVVSQISMIR